MITVKGVKVHLLLVRFALSCRKLPKSDSADFVDAPKFHYDMDFDLRALKAALKSAEFLEESGYQSVLERSQNNQYGTGWLINENMSEDGSDDVDDNWDGQQTEYNIAVSSAANEQF
uniref:GPN-loop GTPase 2 n=1 Tax=Ascaris lumbricoides TaxID=6252 RepID=A0A0M3I384_ASCLU